MALIRDLKSVKPHIRPCSCFSIRVYAIAAEDKMPKKSETGDSNVPGEEEHHSGA